MKSEWQSGAFDRPARTRAATGIPEGPSGPITKAGPAAAGLDRELGFLMRLTGGNAEVDEG